MKLLAAALGVLLLLLVLVLVRPWGGATANGDAPPAAAASLERPASDERLAALERRLGELEATLAALGRDLERVDAARRSPVSDPALPLAAAAPAAAAAGDPRGPSWYLEQYVASFANGGNGSEYFRLAVEAYAPSLLREIGAIVLDPRANSNLRRSLVEMLGDARFRGHDAAIDLLLRLLPWRGEEALVEAAITALQHVGDERTAPSLEGLLWSIESPGNRWKAVQAFVALAGPEANAALLRLWPRIPEDGDRSFVIGQVRSDEGEHSLELFGLASFGSPGVRLQAARAIGQFRFPGFPPFIESWIARETEAEVRAALGASKTALSQPPNWSPERAAGPPDADPGRDDPKAWASAQPDMGEQWLELVYDPPLRASAVRVFEVCVPGAVAAIIATDERNGRHELWSGTDPTSSPGVFDVQFAATPFRVKGLRLVLDTNRRSGWSEIDAVELVGPDGRAWAVTARASSYFGAGSGAISR